MNLSKLSSNEREREKEKERGEKEGRRESFIRILIFLVENRQFERLYETRPHVTSFLL
jgi:hypothetical protein